MRLTTVTGMTIPAAEPNEIRELRERVAALEAMVASIGQPQTAPAALPSRRAWLGLLAGAGAASMLTATAKGETPAPLGAWKTYSPKLTGEKSNPVLGDVQSPKPWTKAGSNGHYWQHGRTIVVKTWIQFGPGAEPGSGHYRLSLPVPAALGSDAWLGPTGMALLHSAATNINRNASVVLPNADFVVFQLDNSDKIVGHDNPWVWAKNDGFNTFMIYEAANDA